jgi:Fe-S cluster assembly ATPase SufC
VSEPLIVNINHCNNINEGNIKIIPKFLNIKYAANGTGKSTIAKAIKLTSEGDNLADLKSYGVEENPSVESNLSIDNVFIFNDDFVNNFVFLESEVIDNSFEIFIKSEDYDEKLQVLNERLKDLRINLNQNEEIVELRGIIRSVDNKIQFNQDGGIKNNPFIKSLISDEHIFNVPENLAIFRPFIESSYTVDWIDWKNKGYAFDDKNKCPFCTEEFGDDYETEKSAFKKSYTKSNAQNMKTALGFFESLQKYMPEDKFNLLNECIISITDEVLIKNTLATFTTELLYIEDKIREIIAFDSCRIQSDEISRLDEKLSNFKINPSSLNVFNSSYMNDLVTHINGDIDSILAEVTSLKGEVGALKKLIQAPAKKYRNDINSFLESAGINYEILIDVLSENDSKTILKYKDGQNNTHKVDDIKKRLSWGEKNAFALVLFMHYAVSNNADLIILDDPISSFDSDKKYAIINRLFENTNHSRSFFNKTVLLLTHDFEPVVDFVVNAKPTSEFVSATYLVNKDGIVSETEIDKRGVISQTKLLGTVVNDSDIGVIHRLIALRKLIDYTGESDEEKFAYDLISCITHAKDVPDRRIDYEHCVELSTDEVELGTSYIQSFIPDFSYDQVLNSNRNSILLIDAYNNETCSYLKLQLCRIYLRYHDIRADFRDDVLLKYIDETYHIENDLLYTLDFRQFDIVPNFILKRCDNYMKSQLTT